MEETIIAWYSPDVAKQFSLDKNFQHFLKLLPGNLPVIVNSFTLLGGSSKGNIEDRT